MIDATFRTTDAGSAGVRIMTLGAPPQADTPSPDRFAADQTAKARALQADRRRRKTMFALSSQIFHEPAWDILLDLFVAEGEDRVADFAALCANAGIQGPTALRWITTLEQVGLVHARVDQAGGLPLLRLTPNGRAAMQNYLSGVGSGRD